LDKPFEFFKEKENGDGLFLRLMNGNRE